MSTNMNPVRATILATIYAIFQGGRYATVTELQNLKVQMGVDGNTFGAEIDSIAGEGLLGQNPDGTFGLTPAGIQAAQSATALLQQAQAASAPAPQPVPAQVPAQMVQQPVPQPQPAPVPQPQPGGKGGKKGGKKGQQQADAGQQQPQSPAGFTMKYKLMNELSVAEIQRCIQVWTLAAEANFNAGHVLVADGLMRSVSRAKRRLRNLQRGLPDSGGEE